MDKFSSSNIQSDIKKALAEKAIEIPSEIQAKTIPVLLTHEGDFIGRSATGTGKTYAYGAPLLSRIDADSGKVQAVVLVPTRELCEQVGKELTFLSKYMPNLKTESIYGGVSLKTQIHDLSNGTHVIVATPGRLMDLVQRNVVHLETLKYVVFDEADEMLFKGFQTDIDKILATANRSYATWLFSATMPDKVNEIINKYLHKDLIKVMIGKAETPNKGIQHQLIELAAEQKLDALLQYLKKYSNEKCIIFCRTKSGVQKLYKQLSANKFSCGAIHGDLPQGLRNKVMDQFRAGSISTLIATDVASRGVDIDNVSVVFQYHMPDTKESYTHRSGRTSRAGKTGISLTFIFPEEREKWDAIKKDLDLTFKTLPVPSQKDQLVGKAMVWAGKIAKSKPVGDKLDAATRQEFKDQLKHLSKDELLEKLLATYLREQQG
ncbi:DEAD/DEAH box helicase [Reichenbachiella carrageenanivorans]|uniref:DEAD/DEAH box helicase n=1 Tax=Reichenbachiella carrageenanivorans TaxID=2979869 RepID=A0ABY6CWS7_9BACT|nr:DEAD/DEAH box helicase [Reichenbachiella carrageenanivorans]UXX78367.1 DEAD/DEAH box helicase [Reichenbachiella carrageenanivorans]